MKPLLICLFVLIMTSALGAPISASAAAPSDLSQQADLAMNRLLKSNQVAALLAPRAKAVLIFPHIVKAGLVIGGAYGEGMLKVGDRIDGYYNSVTASLGWQIGAQYYGYAVFLMNDKALKYIHDTQGWEIGVGPTVVVVNEGAAKNISSTSLKDDAYAFIFDQQGLMASLSIEGSKISPIQKP